MGDDVNPCSRTAPCKTWAGAISKTSPFGEIDALDPGGFGGVTITKSITLDGGGYTAGVLVAGTNGIIVSAGAGDVVTLRGLDINGTNAGLSGIQVIAAGTVSIEKVRVYGFLNSGIGLTIPASGTTNVVIQDTIVKDCAPPTGVAVSATGLATAVGNLNVLVNNLEAHHCQQGLIAGGGTAVSASKFTAPPTAGAKATVTVHNSDFSNNVQGVVAGINTTITLDTGNIAFCTSAITTTDPSATIRLSNMTITDNGFGISPGLGSVISFLNNRILGNGADGAPSMVQSQR